MFKLILLIVVCLVLFQGITIEDELDLSMEYPQTEYDRCASAYEGTANYENIRLHLTTF